MKKFIRALIITISSAILLYGAYVCVDCVRLSRVGTSDKPLITINEIRGEDYWKCEGLGYTVTYKFDPEKAVASGEEGEENAYPGSHIYGAEFKLFDKILLWAWIEDSDVEVEKFSYEEERSEFGETDGSIKIKDFHNTPNDTINNKEQAIEVAKNEVTVEYDSVSVAFDEKVQMWKVNFSKEGYLGGDQTVYLNKDGTTQLCVWGE